MKIRAKMFIRSRSSVIYHQTVRRVLMKSFNQAGVNCLGLSSVAVPNHLRLLSRLVHTTKATSLLLVSRAVSVTPPAECRYKDIEAQQTASTTTNIHVDCTILYPQNNPFQMSDQDPNNSTAGGDDVAVGEAGLGVQTGTDHEVKNNSPPDNDSSLSSNPHNQVDMDVSPNAQATQCSSENTAADAASNQHENIVYSSTQSNEERIGEYKAQSEDVLSSGNEKRESDTNETKEHQELGENSLSKTADMSGSRTNHDGEHQNVSTREKDPNSHQISSNDVSQKDIALKSDSAIAIKTEDGTYLCNVNTVQPNDQSANDVNTETPHGTRLNVCPFTDSPVDTGSDQGQNHPSDATVKTACQASDLSSKDTVGHNPESSATVRKDDLQSSSSLENTTGSSSEHGGQTKKGISNLFPALKMSKTGGSDVTKSDHPLKVHEKENGFQNESGETTKESGGTTQNKSGTGTRKSENGDVVLVTGGCGFLGQHVVKMLQLKAPHVSEIWVLDLQPFERKLDYLATKRVKTLVGDVSDAKFVRWAVNGADSVIHVAGLASWGTFPDISGMEKINIIGTLNVFNACLVNNVKRLIFCSTVDVVVGKEPIRGGDEYNTQIPDKFLFPGYPETKYHGERIIAGSAKLKRADGGKLQTVSLRANVCYGELDNAYVTSALRSAMNNKGILYQVGNGKAKFQQAYVGNAAWAFICADKAMKDNPSLSEEVFFIPDDTPVQNSFTFVRPFIEARGFRLSGGYLSYALSHSAISAAEMVAKGLSPLVKINLPVQSCTIAYINTDLYFSGAKAKKILKYEPLFSPDEALAVSMKYYANVDLEDGSKESEAP